ncbi:Bcr/CflA family multidrug efflux MFS transporter [Marinobacter sp. CHS3-4]|uniref:Bcr/CflA family multidrug efflux MFS transporter n=1 Tax=Marinobacter sp. CHS3-4 TaxID=3045174 RepID=UPI0024B4932F|nr:Bcr/CflA family multidrug efflux MFS transporter [Marinobacter sp. CHS3-4]MDI9243910.1 Bcr/CflA family multidrug efflux MFS transporter [Marinobacter sp. CHS3-4]
MLALTSIYTTILLAAAVALGPLAIDLYLPALPMMGQDLSASTSQVQLTLSVYMAGFAMAQLLCGPLADRFGRKPIMIGGFLLFALASIGCAMATNIETLILFRFLQALGGSAGPVLGRAAVRDIYTPREAARIMAILASIMALAPAIAPTLGGFMAVSLGWESLFIALGCYSLLMAAVVAIGIPETMNPAHRQSMKLRSLLRNYRTVITNVPFLGYTLTNSLTFAGLFAFLSGSSFVLIDFLGVKPEHFGLYFACGVAGYIAGNLAAIRLGHTLSSDEILVRGLVVTMISGLVMAGLALAGVFNVWAVMVPQIVAMVGVGMVLPQTMAGALANFPTMAGSASALFGCAQMVIAAIVGGLVGYLHSGSSVVMAVAIALCSTAAFIGYGLLIGRQPTEEPVPAAEPA